MPAMGFRRQVDEGKMATMLVMAELTGRPEEEIGEIARAGIAIGMIDASASSASSITKLMKQKGELITGLVVSGAKPGNLSKAVTGDVDFIVFGTEMPLSSFEGLDVDSIGKVLRVDTATEANLLRAVHGLYPAIDAVMIDIRVQGLTVEQVMRCRRTAEISGQPVIALAPKSLIAAELMALREAGVKVVVFAADVPVEELRKLSERIQTLPAPQRRKGGKDLVLLPRTAARPAESEGGDDDGDDPGE